MARYRIMYRAFANPVEFTAYTRDRDKAIADGMSILLEVDNLRTILMCVRPEPNDSPPPTEEDRYDFLTFISYEGELP